MPTQTDRPTPPAAPPSAGLRRIARRPDAFMVPRALPGEPGRFVVDGTWGMINPIVLEPGVRTIGELELIAHAERGLPLIDSRRAGLFAQATIPGAVSIPHVDAVARISELDPALDSVLFCNGPQCAATPQAIRALLGCGHPAERLLYYRGGLHDWLTLGLPSAPGTVLAPVTHTSPEGGNMDDRITIDEATRIGETIGIDWSAARFDAEQFRIGLNVELEHGLHDPATNVTGDDPELTGKIALAHLNEFPDYYTRLKRMEDEADRYWAGR